MPDEFNKRIYNFAKQSLAEPFHYLPQSKTGELHNHHSKLDEKGNNKAQPMVVHKAT